MVIWHGEVFSRIYQLIMPLLIRREIYMFDDVAAFRV